MMRKDDGPRVLPWGVKPNPPFAPLRRAVRPAGLRLDDELSARLIARGRNCKRSVTEG